MALLSTGASGVVRGCLPRGCTLAARFDRAAGVIQLDSPELNSFSIKIDVSKLHEFSPTQKPTSDVLEREARIVAKYDVDAGELRYESPDVPEFWVEVDVQQIMQSKRQKVMAGAAGAAGDDATGGAVAGGGAARQTRLATGGAADDSAFEKHLAIIKPELRLTRHSSVTIQPGQSNNTFWGVGALLDEIERKGGPIHIVLKYDGSDIVVQFYTETIVGKFSMPVLRFHAYTPDAKIADSAILRVVFTCVDDAIMESDECLLANIAKWPLASGDEIIYDLKTVMALYNDDNLANREEDEALQLDLNLRVMQHRGLRTADAVSAREQLREEVRLSTETHVERCRGVLEQRFDCDDERACANWLEILCSYTENSAPPLAPRTREDFMRLLPYMKQTIVFYDGQTNIDTVQRYLIERFPCIMGARILTNVARMHQAFGVNAPLYWTLKVPPPMIGVFTRVPVRVGQDDVDLAVYHMIAPDLCAYADETPTPDLRALIANAGNAMSQDKLMYEAARVHAIAWYLAFAAAHEHCITKLSNVLVGGGSFVPEDWHESFQVKVHNTALYLIGYGTPGFAFPEVELVPPPERVPLRDATAWRDVLHVNAWCHSSFLGNGNGEDPTLDGAWGRSSPIAPFAWPLSNPWLKLRAVHGMPAPPPVRPIDRLCGKPPSYLRRKGEGA